MMKNREKYRDVLENYAMAGVPWRVVDGKPEPCVVCDRCELTGGGCGKKRLEWLEQEYEEPEIDWEKVPIDTKVQVSNDGKVWTNRHFAEVKDGEYYAWDRGVTSWGAGLFHGRTKWKYMKLAEEELGRRVIRLSTEIERLTGEPLKIKG